jgi:hypothetical protein
MKKTAMLAIGTVCLAGYFFLAKVPAQVAAPNPFAQAGKSRADGPSKAALIDLPFFLCADASIVPHDWAPGASCMPTTDAIYGGVRLVH